MNRNFILKAPKYQWLFFTIKNYSDDFDNIFGVTNRHQSVNDCYSFAVKNLLRC